VLPRPWRDHLPAGTEWDPGELIAGRSLPAAWAKAWSACPDAPLVLDAGDPSGSRWVDAAELDERTRSAASRFAGLGLNPGDRVLWSMGSSLDAVVANVGALRAGLVVVPANRLYTERELSHIVSDARPAGAVVDDAERGRWVERAAPGPIVVLDPALRVVGIRSPAPLSSSATPRSVEVPALDKAAPIDPAPIDPALIAYTSGTTGAPKGAVLTHANLLANSESVALTWRWTAEDRLVHALPIFHGHGLCVALYTSLLVGGSVVLMPGFDASEVLDAAASHRASLFFGVPTMYHRIATSGRAGELSTLRLAVSGSAALPAELHRGLEREGHVSVLERYGMTETLMTLSNPYDGERRPGTVGFPFPGVEARVDGTPDDPGEISVRGPTVFAGYWERPAADAERFGEDGWLRTGDMGSVDDHGYVVVRGRRTEMVITGGYNVYPAEVEDVLIGHPAVREVAVTGTPSDEWGEVVTAWVVAEGSAPSADDLAAFAAERLAPYKRPRLVRFVEALPRNAMGKVVRAQLG
jgi:malonyl-CoA/methylmalonyl-CoA synthetase